MLERIISGGQTGVDRGALDAAIALGIAHGGWCPLGRRAEDGRIPSHYRLDEVETADYAARTEKNVIHADATLILHRQILQGGTLLTRRFAKQHNKPFLVIDLEQILTTEIASNWIEDQRVKVLNVAGPRESSRHTECACYFNIEQCAFN